MREHQWKTAAAAIILAGGLVTNSGIPYVFRVSARSSGAAIAFSLTVEKLGIKKVDFLVVKNDWGRGAADDFGKMFKAKGMQVGLVETMDQAAQDMSAQLA